MADRDRVNLEIDPPSDDLAIETDIIHSSSARLLVFTRMGVREVWRWRADSVAFLSLQPDESYVEIAGSRLLPRFTAMTANRFLTSGLTINYTRWRRQFQDHLRDEFPTA